VPSDMINNLSHPTLISLLASRPNSLLIIEDAEGSLSRSRTSDQSVANLLNLSDGLLGDGIQVQILATFNCPLTSLDSALLRPGRLVVQYCFPSTLNIENARSLAQSIGVSKTDQINEPLSLANIYAMKDEKIEEDQDEATSTRCRKCDRFNHYEEGGEEE
jgi:ATP-dependent 26S proteasome regulatory subunit